jgi:hypothetical protein
MIRSLFSRMAIKNGVSIKGRMWLTKYVVGAKANPPKNPRRAPKKGKVMATNIVNAATEKKHVLSTYVQTNQWFVISQPCIGRWKAGVLLTHIDIA